VTGRADPGQRRWPARWLEDAGGGEDVRRARAALDLPDPPPLGGAARARIAARLAGAASERSAPRVRARRLAWVGAVAFLATTAVAIAGGLARRALLAPPPEVQDASGRLEAPVRRAPAAAAARAAAVISPDATLVQEGPAARAERREAPPSPRAASSRRRGAAAGRAVIASPPAIVAAATPGSGEQRTEPVAAAVPAESPEAPEPARPASPQLASPTAGGTPAPTLTATGQDPPVSPPASSEARLLADALARLHADDDAAAALVLLDERERRYPRGALGTEARVARAEVLLSLGRRGEALRALDRVVLERWPRGAELGVTRGELRVEAGRCSEAVRDFTACAEGSRACRAEQQERALVGRSGCRAKLGDESAARADLVGYVRAFPHGRFADRARAALGAAGDRGAAAKKTTPGP